MGKQNLYALLESPKVKAEAKLRLAILYALRYQKYTGNEISQVVKRLLQAGLPESRAVVREGNGACSCCVSKLTIACLSCPQLVFVVLNLAGAEQRQDDLFANENFFSRGKSALKGLKGVDNVYTQHSPHLLETIEQLMKGRLKETSYPYASGSQAPPPMQKWVHRELGGALFGTVADCFSCPLQTAGRDPLHGGRSDVRR